MKTLIREEHILLLVYSCRPKFVVLKQKIYKLRYMQIMNNLITKLDEDLCDTRDNLIN